jgi:hypothetical protein
MRRLGLIACMEEKRNEHRVSIGNLKERDHFEDVELVWIMILKFKMCDVRTWTESIWWVCLNVEMCHRPS